VHSNTVLNVCVLGSSLDKYMGKPENNLLVYWKKLFLTKDEHNDKHLGHCAPSSITIGLGEGRP